MKTLAIVQARMGSSRLPGKVLKEICDKPLILHTLERLKQASTLDTVLLATSDHERDKPLLKLAQKHGFESFAGSEEDVLDRYWQAAQKYKPEVIVRATGDCPVIDPNVCDDVVRAHFEFGADYTTNTIQRSYPRGLDTEVIPYSVLETAAKEAKLPEEREHVTTFIYRRPERFKIHHVVAEKPHYDPSLRICVDTPEDYALIEAIFKNLYPQNPNFRIEEILKFIGENPALRDLNQHIEQKKV